MQNAGRLTRGVNAPATGVKGGFNPTTATAQQYTDEVGKRIGGINQAGHNMNCADCAVNTDLLLRTGQVVPAPGRANTVFPGELAKKFGSPFVPHGKDLEGVTKAMSGLPDGSTGVLFLSRGEQPGHFINVVNKGGEIQFWCGQSGRRVTDPIKEFSLGKIGGQSFDVVGADLMITSKGSRPVIKGSLLK